MISKWFAKIRSIAMSKIAKKKINYKDNYMVVAVDIGKRINSAIFRSPAGEDSQVLEFSNTSLGFYRFYSGIIWHKNKYGTSKVVVGFEPTGVYGEPLIYYLHSKHIQMVQVNPVNSKRARELRDNSPNKTDQKDPKVIADLIQLNCYLSVIVPKEDAAELRHTTHARERAIDFQNKCTNQLEALVCKIFPEFFHVFKSVKSKTAQYLLQHCVDPEQIAVEDLDHLSGEIRRMSRGRVNRSKLDKYQQFAKDTIGVKEGKKAVLKEIEQIVQKFIQNEECIKELEEDISGILQRIPASKLIMSIKGIGLVTTAIILGETAIFHNMRKSREVEKFAGLNLYEISSGVHKGQKRISKRGRNLLRKMLYFGALNVIKHDNVFKEAYHHHLKKGMPKNKALIAIARKLLRVIFALVRDEANFDKEYQDKHIMQKAA
jgi:transposase